MIRCLGGSRGGSQKSGEHTGEQNFQIGDGNGQVLM